MFVAKKFGNGFEYICGKKIFAPACYVAGSEIEYSAELNNKNLSFLSLLQVVTNITIYVVVQVQDFQLRGKRGLTEKEPKCAKQKWYLFSVCFGKKVDMQRHTLG